MGAHVRVGEEAPKRWRPKRGGKTEPPPPPKWRQNQTIGRDPLHISLTSSACGHPKWSSSCTSTPYRPWSSPIIPRSIGAIRTGSSQCQTPYLPINMPSLRVASANGFPSTSPQQAMKPYSSHACTSIPSGAASRYHRIRSCPMAPSPA